MNLFTLEGRPESSLARLWLLGSMLIIAFLFGAAPASAQVAWPADADWVWMANDGEEGGIHNNQRDVESLYYTVRDGYLFLRMKNRGPAGWCAVCGQSYLHARYKWMFDTANGDGVLSGGSVYNTEYMLMTEDLDDNLLGEVTFLDSAGLDYNTRWPSYDTNIAGFANYQRVLGALVHPTPPPDTAYLGIPQGGANLAVGYRVYGDDGVLPIPGEPYFDGIYVDMFIDLALLGAQNSNSLRLLWLTDQEDANLDQAPCCDRPDDGNFLVIPLKGTLTIVKDVPGTNAQDFAFTSNIPGGAAFSLDDDADATLPASRVFSSLDPGSYSVTESATAGWNLSDLTCTNQNGYVSTFTPNLATGSVSVDLIAGSDLVCRFVNVAVPVPGSYTLTVVKSAEPHSAQLFDFTLTGQPAFQLSDPSDPSRSFSLTPGSAYTLTEAAVGGWTTALTCSDPSVVVAGATATLPATIVDGSSVTCVYTNTQLASVTIAKIAAEATPLSYAFTSTLPGGAAFNLASGGSLPLAGILPGVYTVTEGALPNGYSLLNINCSDLTGRSSFTTDITTRTATLTVGAGANVTCTFNNAQNGNLIIILDAIPDGPQAFPFQIGMGNFELTDDGSAVYCTENMQCFYNISPGAYPMHATMPAGWQLTGISCTGGATPATIDLAAGTAAPNVGAGETVTCTFVAEQQIVTPVPALDHWRLVLLALMLAGLGMVAVRRA
ncbi:MAG: hypothetical protein QG662_861 [Pseudomonadota bacterium]|nr:hypothetical protein [Pseudomonadota bacterium]